MKLNDLFLFALLFPLTFAILGNDVEGSQVAQEGHWALSPEPLVQIGVAIGDPAYEFHRIAGAVRLSNGHIAIADGGSNEVRFYDATGGFLKTVGGQGGGPEEFQRI